MAIFNHQFYNQSLRRYIVAFGNMFADMKVQRLDEAGATVQTLGVPIEYAPKEKFLARLASDPNLDRPIAVQMPALSFEITNMTYDGTRRLNGTQLNMAVNTSVPGAVKTQYVPVPWNIHFNLYIFVRNADDGAQLLEQILPFFGPEWTNDIKLIPSLNIKMQIPTILNGVDMEDAYSGNFEQRRALVYTLAFTTKGYFFGPINASGSRTKLIKRIQIDFGAVPLANVYSNLYDFITPEIAASTARSSRVVITPGLLANGSPTTNSAASINYQLISANSNYGIASNTFFYTDGKHYNPVTGGDE